MLGLRVASLAVRRVAPVAVQARWKAAKAGAAKKAVKKASVAEKAVKKQLVAKKTVAKKAVAAKKTAAKKAVAAKKAAHREKAAVLREKARAKKAAAKAKADAKKAAAKAKKDAVRQKKAQLKASGPVHPYSLFVQQQAKSTGKKVDLKSLAAGYKALSAAKKDALVKQAKVNLSKRHAVRKAQKRPASKYAQFVKQHFKAAYEAELKKAGGDRKAAFRGTAKVLAQKYKSQ